jgi:hypothetical protein
MFPKEDPVTFKLQREQFKVEIRKEQNETLFSKSRVRINGAPTKGGSSSVRAFNGENPAGAEAYNTSKIVIKHTYFPELLEYKTGPIQ